MKAKEYALRIIKVASSPEKEFNETLLQVSADLIDEIESLLISRHCKCNAAFTAVLDEMDDKYQSIVRIVNSELGVDLLFKDGFREMLLSYMDRIGMSEIRHIWRPKKIGG